eukprot:173463-Pelagomonas_calceolata.AAC.1
MRRVLVMWLPKVILNLRKEEDAYANDVYLDLEDYREALIFLLRSTIQLHPRLARIISNVDKREEKEKQR